MKKVLLLFTLAAGLVNANAQPQDALEQPGAMQRLTENSVLSFKPERPINEITSADGTKKIVHNTPAKIGEVLPGEIITEQPEGRVVQYDKNATSWRVTMGTYYSMPASGYVATVVYADDNVVYIKDPCTFKPLDTWIKGKIEGDYIVCEPQPLFKDMGYEYNAETGEYDEHEYHYSIRLLHCDLENESYYLGEDQSFRYKITEDGLEIDLPELYDVAGLYCDEDESFVWYGDMVNTYRNFKDPITELPAGVQPQTYTFKRSGYINLCQVGFDGKDVYIGALPSIPEGVWVKGTFNDENKIVVKGAQYLGRAKDKTGVERSLYLMATHHVYTEDYIPGYYYYEYEIIDQTEFDYDENTKSFTNIGENTHDDGTSLVVNYGTTLVFPGETTVAPYIDMLVSPFVETAATPIPPTFVDLAPFQPSWGYGYIGVRVNQEGTEGEYISKDKLYYRIWVDDEVLTLTPDVYSDITEEISVLPYDFKTETNVSINDDYLLGYHRVLFYIENFKTIGAQTIYQFDGQEYRSKISRYNMETAKHEIVDEPADVYVVDMDAANIVRYDARTRNLLFPAEGHVLIYSLSGAKVVDRMVADHLDVSNFPAGAYIVTFGGRSIKFIK